MRLALYNGSPRGKKSSTAMLVDEFRRGVTAVGDHEVNVSFLVQHRSKKEFVARFENADAAILAYPLYTDAMPAIVKEFIEDLGSLRGRAGNPALGFIVQSGFVEARHSRFVERYHKKLARRLGCRYLERSSGATATDSMSSRGS
jgi:multimeric flavodoxin WrbA